MFGWSNCLLSSLTAPQISRRTPSVNVRKWNLGTCSTPVYLSTVYDFLQNPSCFLKFLSQGSLCIVEWKKKVTHDNFSFINYQLSFMRISSNVHLQTLSVFEKQRKPSFIYRHWKVGTSYANRKWFLSLIHGFFAVFRRAQSYLKSREYFFSGCEHREYHSVIYIKLIEA